MKNVLIVDDSKFIRSIVKEEISRVIDANIIMASSYKETKQILQENFFHVAVLDLHLPDADNGEIVDLVVQNGIASVVLTGGINATTKNIILQKDIIEYVTKSDPENIRYVASIIKRILNNYDTTVLIVDDSRSSRELLKSYLDNLKVKVVMARHAKEAIEKISSSDYSISMVLTDYMMPDMNGFDLTMYLRQSYSKDQLAIIAISGINKPHLVADFLRHGANDFIKKPYTQEELTVRVNINLELLDLFKENQDNANKDFLTGLYNRRFFFERANAMLAKAKRKKSPLAVAMLDIDFFKRINDTYGHSIGDIAIKEVATVLHKTLRESDLVARFGGEEFCLLLEDTSLEDVAKKFEEIREVFEKNIITVDNVSFSYTVSIGICYGINDSLEILIGHSDEALYYAKENGRNRIKIEML
ncbi:MAG: diguanylate cyclase [Campylobacterota bacterium]|nr:diguanylate cyclase [Campylobacterota bacterium]